MKIGSNISKDQEQLLARVRRGGPAQFDAFFQVSQDGDIRGDREDLHPDSLELFEAQRSGIERQLPSEVFRSVTSFFEEARPIDPTLARINPSRRRLRSCSVPALPSQSLL